MELLELTGIMGEVYKMTKCVFCGREEQYFKGLHLIQNNGEISYFCSSKCRKNALKLKRDKRKLKWTLAYKEELEKSRQKEKAKPVVSESKKIVKKDNKKEK